MSPHPSAGIRTAPERVETLVCGGADREAARWSLRRARHVGATYRPGGRFPRRGAREKERKTMDAVLSRPWQARVTTELDGKTDRVTGGGRREEQACDIQS